MRFLRLRKLGNICPGYKMFLNKIRNIFCVLDTKSVSTTNVARAGKRGNICVGNNVSATMCPCLPGPLRTEFFPPRFMAQARIRSARAINWRGKKLGSVTYSTDRENEVSEIFIISLVCVWGAQERFLFTRNGFKFLTHLESKTSQFEIVFKSLEYKKCFKFLLAIKVKNSWR